jgi:hypothetical protein
LEEILKNLITDSVTDAVTDAGIEAVPDPNSQEAIDFILNVPADPTAEEMAWGVVDVMLDTGAAEGLMMLFGGPVAAVVALKAFKRWRQKTRA